MTLPAMLLCAGYGTRLRPITDWIPKPLVPVGDRPGFLHALDALNAMGFGPLCLNTHHRASAFDGCVPYATRVIHEPEILGTAGGLRNAAHALGSGDVLVWNGDVVAQPDLSGLIAEHTTHQPSALATLLAAPRPYGVGTLGIDSQGHVVRLRREQFGCEVSGADFIGIQVLSSSLRDRLPERGCLVGDVYLPVLRKGGCLRAAFYDGDWDDIGTVASLLSANRRWLARMGKTSWIGDGARVDARVDVEQSVVCNNARVIGQGPVRACLVLPGGCLRAPAHDLVALDETRVAHAAVQ